MYVFHLLLKLAYPTKSIKLDELHYSMKIYYIEVVCAFIVGTVPYIILASLSKFQIVNFPPLYCGGDATGTFYGIILPTVVLNCTTLILLLIVLYHIHTVSIHVIIIINE